MNIDKNTCYGCGVCVIICKSSAISIELSESGFWIPKIDQEKCVYHCGLCEKTCSFLYDGLSEQVNKMDVRAYSFITGDKNLLPLVSSGGAGYGIGKYFLDKGYNVLGVGYDYQKNIAFHTIIKDEKMLNKTIGSKYIQSYTADAIKKIKNGDHVIFGCPCFIDSFKRLIKINNNKEQNFILVDFFCHGVPSYHLWRKYLSFHLKNDERLVDVKFRDKCNGWGEYTMTMTMSSDKYFSKSLRKNDYFLNIYLSNFVLNEPCYSCKFRGLDSSADIRIGDLWGKKYEKNKTGVSCVVCFTYEGQNVIKQLSSFGIICEENIETVLKGQIVKNILMPKSRSSILKILKSNIYLPLLYYFFFYRRWIKNAFPSVAREKFKFLLEKYCSRVK